MHDPIRLPCDLPDLVFGDRLLAFQHTRQEQDFFLNIGGEVEQIHDLADTRAGDGTIDPGVLLTPEGLRIEEDSPVSVSVSPGDATFPRFDLVVCIHEYLPTVPNVAAHFEVVTGTPADNPDYPDLPEHAVLLATCRMEKAETSWKTVANAGPPVGTAWELAGPARTTETVYDNTEAIIDLAGTGRTSETVKGNADDIADETTNRQNADDNLQQQITNHLDDTTSPHAASSVPIQDSNNRYTAENVESALQEIAGVGRSNQTVKGNTDSITNHVENASGAHAASAISSQAISGSPFSLSQSEVQAALASMVTAMNLRSLKSGDTFSGPVTFQSNVIFDADDVDNVKFDGDVTFARTVSVAAGLSTNCTFSNAHGSWKMQQTDDEVAMPIPGMDNCKLHNVKFYFMNEPGNPNPTDVNCSVYKKTAYTTSANAILIAEENSSILADPVNNMPGAIDVACNDQDMVYQSGAVAHTYYAVAKLTETDTMDSPCHFIGVLVEYKRRRVVV